LDLQRKPCPRAGVARGRIFSLDFVGDDDITGDGGANSLFGGTGNDVLRGMDGADTLDGGAGDGVLTGGAGLDRFVIAPGFGRDTITDFGATRARRRQITDNRAVVFADSRHSYLGFQLPTSSAFSD
jgi:Ca2+-binding RTX toxin-like protein